MLVLESFFDHVAVDEEILAAGVEGVGGSEGGGHPAQPLIIFERQASCRVRNHQNQDKERRDRLNDSFDLSAHASGQRYALQRAK